MSSKASCSVKTVEEQQQWMQKIHTVQSRRAPEELEAARRRTEQARLTEASYRKCKSVKGHAVRSQALVCEGLKQMSSSRPEEHMAVQARWKSAQEASKVRQERSYAKASAALALIAPNESQVECLSDVEDEEREGMEEVAALVGTADVSGMVAMGTEGMSAEPGTAPVSRGGAVQSLLEQLRKEPKDEAECTSKFLLYEGYGSEVQDMRQALLKFYEESRPTVPAAVASSMDKQINSIDSREAMGIPDDAREWFVYHMMRQAQKNNSNMGGILDGFEKKLEFLAANDQSECPICLESFSEGGEHAAETLGCCHKCCKDCWANWSAAMHGRPFCPLCKEQDFLGVIAQRVSPMASA